MEEKVFITLGSIRDTIDQFIKMHGEDTIVEDFEITINPKLKLKGSTTKSAQNVWRQRKTSLWDEDIVYTVQKYTEVHKRTAYLTNT